jgi:rhamnose utilization protein RhaD (predicted bifunctional aldolase and dehydrogenase)
MRTASTDIEKQVKAFCARIGADPLLVQGAGGNVSWKDGDVLWVKASGTWLAEAESKEIFVPVNLAHLQSALAKQDFSVKPEIATNNGLRPSIETLLHALMPHRVVVHLHAVEILAHLVQVNAIQKIENLVGDAVKWIYVDYFKPGADLAREVSERLAHRTDADVLFLESHGVVIGGEDIESIVNTLLTLTSKLQNKLLQPLPEKSPSLRKLELLAMGYIPCEDTEIGLLTNQEMLINRLRQEWALYPDHVVFLGAEPAILESNFKQQDFDEIICDKPPFIFLVQDGVYEHLNATAAQKAQLRCYYDVIIRQDPTTRLSTLNNRQVRELLNWDAEKFRSNSAK